ncbi:Ionotropic receptor [Operophtera brumata]|uniref:Ionotropic receptor n=1 Tax=Operophtera brumata TaxID=104452 RepID=A0A0L7LEV9_OPEBR|nr:Ionotropic receptor [Operophtera brumata]
MNEACHRKQASSRNLFRAPYRWLILTNASATKEVLLNSSVLADSDVVIAERSGDQFEMIEIHRPSHNHSAVLTPRGLFKGALHDTRPRRELFRRRMDLMGHVLTMANVIQDSNRTKYHLPREDGLDFQNDATTKISWMTGKIAFLMLNATPRYIFSYRWGYKPPLSYVSNIYSLPFSARVWVGTAVCAVVSAVALCVATRWEAVFGKSSTQLDGGISDAMFLTMSRITVWSVFAALMALHAAYSANIVTLLQAPSHSIATLSQLASSKITLAAYDQYKDPVRVSIHKRIEPEKGKQQFYDLSEGVDRIRQTFLENEKCDLAEIDFMNTFDPYAPMKKDSPYLELIRVAFKRIRETGVRSAINRRHQTPKPRCAGHVASFASVGAGELRPVLTLMAIGITLSLAILCMELLIHHL